MYRPTQKALCTSLARVHEHKDTFDKLSNLHEIYTILVSFDSVNNFKYRSKSVA